MIHYFTHITKAGEIYVAYRRAHRNEIVPVCDCNTVGQADEECARLNREQRRKYIPPKVPGTLGSTPRGFYSDYEG